MASCLSKHILASWIISISTAYFLSHTQLTWSQSEAFCVDHCQSHLGSLHSHADHDTVIDILSSDPILSASEKVFAADSDYDGDCWIGLSDQGQLGSLYWTDGSTFNYSSWNDNEPAMDEATSNYVRLLDNHAVFPNTYPMVTADSGSAAV